MRWRLHTIRLSRRVKHHLRWALIHTALMFFFADLLGAFWPEFEHVWGPVLRKGIAWAAFAATLAEYIVDEGGADHTAHQKEDDE